MKKHIFLDKANKNFKLNPLEYTIHCHIAQYLDMVIKQPNWWHTVEVSNQANGKAAMIRQMMLKKKGVKTSWPDIEVFWRKPGHFNYTIVLFFEVKVPGEDATPKQKILHDQLRDDGYSVFVVHGVDEVESILKDLKVI